MFNRVKNVIGGARRNPFILLIATALLWGAAEISRFLPMDAVFSPSVSWIDFFEMPIIKFYPVLALAVVEMARRAGILALILFLLTLGAISSCIKKDIRKKYSTTLRGSLVILALALFAIALFRIGSVSSPSAAAAALAFALLYGIILVRQEKVKQNPLAIHGA